MMLEISTTVGSRKLEKGEERGRQKAG